MTWRETLRLFAKVVQNDAILHDSEVDRRTGCRADPGSLTISQTRTLLVLPAAGEIGGIQTSGETALSCLSAAQPKAVEPLYIGRLSGESSTDRISVRSKAKSFARAINAPSADVILVWHIGLLPSFKVMRSKNASLVLFLHGIEAWETHTPSVTRRLRTVDLFITNSDHTWRKFVQLNPEFIGSRHETVHLGLNTPADLIADPAAAPMAVTIGRMFKSENYKGHAELIAAWPGVLDKVPDAELTFVGEGDLVPELQSRIKERSLGAHIHFAGLVSEERKRELIVRSRCMLLPSSGEGFGLAYLEALRLGRPSLVGVADAGPEVVCPPEAGLAADPQDRDALIGAITELMTLDPQWFKWSEQAKAKYDSQFTASHFGARLREALNQASS